MKKIYTFEEAIELVKKGKIVSRIEWSVPLIKIQYNKKTNYIEVDQLGGPIVFMPEKELYLSEDWYVFEEKSIQSFVIVE